MTEHPPAKAWRTPLSALAIVLASILVLYQETAVAMVTIWYRSGTFNHAFIVPPIALWLIWRRRDALFSMVPRPAPALLILMAGLAFAWLVGDLVAVNSVTQLAFVAMLVLAVPAVLGIAVANVIQFPLAFVFFSVPIGEFLMPWFMEMTADFTVAALRLTGIPVLREGLQFVIPSGNWSVVEACSGIRYLIASVTVGTLFAYLNYQSTKRRVLFVLVSIAVPVLANWLRAYMIVMMGHLSGNKLAVGVDHLVYGWVFFGIVIMLMFMVGARWSEHEPAPVRANADTATPPPVSSSPATLWLVTAGLVCLAVAPAGTQWFIERHAAAGQVTLVAPASLGAGWTAADAAGLGFKPNFENPSAEMNAVFDRSGVSVGVYLGFYRNQDYDRKLVSSTNVLVVSTDKVWSQLAGGAREARFGERSAIVRTATLRRLSDNTTSQSGRLVAWQIYWIGGTLTANDYLAKVYSAIYRLMGRGDDSAVIVLYTVNDSSRSAEATLDAFLQSNFGVIDALLRQASAGK